MFNKTGATEQAIVLDDEGKVRRIYAHLGKDEASELEIARAARESGIALPKLSQFTEPGVDGRLRLKRV